VFAPAVVCRKGSLATRWGDYSIIPRRQRSIKTWRPFIQFQSEDSMGVECLVIVEIRGKLGILTGRDVALNTELADMKVDLRIFRSVEHTLPHGALQ
jgi:hypothetical protein